ncbi:GntR family transcriptional regulator [Tepidibacter hydrothermalis]|uniref:GntR family transcriptional regulator n=1 Tax=Tepidibacter hydrothermalis TaxID=3036126 RepID=A0ABY8EFZ7_9FIRM|nr:GntR family transcriptional regulator [Tepidibacter hydrothermalis]WFD10679.1 GntR family transcriptional regulator [Tepidibacter hydrothermalis]
MKDEQTNQSLMDLAYIDIKNKILNLTYPPGSALTESGLAKELESSRMPVRMAIKRLEIEGLLVAGYRKKIRVKEVTRKDVLEIYQLRSLFEENALKMIFDMDKTWEYSHRLEAKVVNMRGAHNNVYDWEVADTEMHKELISVFENDRINKIYQNNQNELIRIGLICGKSSVHIKEVNDRLVEFVEAIRNKEYELANSILKEDHLESGLEMALEKITI